MAANEKPALITDAEPSPEEQLRVRQWRYGIMMGIRALLLIVATILASLRVPLLWLWLPLCALGMVLLPWMAVLIANDRLPKQDRRLFRRFRPAKPEPAAPSALEQRHTSVIDVDS